MKLNSKDFETIMSASDILDKEMEALRGGAGGNIITIKCDVGKAPKGATCATGIYEYAEGGMNTDPAT